MKTIQEVFNGLNQVKTDLKTNKKIYKDALESSDNYKKIIEEIKLLQERKKQIELITKKSLGDQYQKIEDLAIEAKTKQEMLNDVAITTLMKNETVEVEKAGYKYDPEWRVKFKKGGLQRSLFN